jgi:hypothetical protein
LINIGSRQIGRRRFLKGSGKLAAGMTFSGAAGHLLMPGPTADPQANSLKVWSDQPAFTRVFENQKDRQSFPRGCRDEARTKGESGLVSIASGRPEVWFP